MNINPATGEGGIQVDLIPSHAKDLPAARAKFVFTKRAGGQVTMDLVRVLFTPYQDSEPAEVLYLDDGLVLVERDAEGHTISIEIPRHIMSPLEIPETATAAATDAALRAAIPAVMISWPYFEKLVRSVAAAKMAAKRSEMGDFAGSPLPKVPVAERQTAPLFERKKWPRASWTEAQGGLASCATV